MLYSFLCDINGTLVQDVQNMYCNSATDLAPSTVSVAHTTPTVAVPAAYPAPRVPTPAVYLNKPAGSFVPLYSSPELSLSMAVPSTPLTSSTRQTATTATAHTAATTTANVAAATAALAACTPHSRPASMQSRVGTAPDRNSVPCFYAPSCPVRQGCDRDGSGDAKSHPVRALVSSREKSNSYSVEPCCTVVDPSSPDLGKGGSAFKTSRACEGACYSKPDTPLTSAPSTASTTTTMTTRTAASTPSATVGMESYAPCDRSVSYSGHGSSGVNGTHADTAGQGFVHVHDGLVKSIVRVKKSFLVPTTGLAMERRPTKPTGVRDAAMFVCQYYQSGNCAAGSSCFDAHIDHDHLAERRREVLQWINELESTFNKAQEAFPADTLQVFAMDLKEMLSVPMSSITFTRGLFTDAMMRQRIFDKLPRATSKGEGAPSGHRYNSVVTASSTPQAPTSCGLFCEDPSLCRWKRWCNQVHIAPEWLAAKRAEFQQWYNTAALRFQAMLPESIILVYDPHTRLTLQIAKHGVSMLTRGIFHNTHNRLPSVCMLFQQSRCTAGCCCNQIHIFHNYLVYAQSVAQEQVAMGLGNPVLPLESMWEVPQETRTHPCLPAMLHFSQPAQPPPPPPPLPPPQQQQHLQLEQVGKSRTDVMPLTESSAAQTWYGMDTGMDATTMHNNTEKALPSSHAAAPPPPTPPQSPTLSTSSAAKLLTAHHVDCQLTARTLHEQSIAANKMNAMYPEQHLNNKFHSLCHNNLFFSQSHQLSRVFAIDYSNTDNNTSCSSKNEDNDTDERRDRSAQARTQNIIPDEDKLRKTLHRLNGVHLNHDHGNFLQVSHADRGSCSHRSTPSSSSRTSRSNSAVRLHSAGLYHNNPYCSVSTLIDLNTDDRSHPIDRQRMRMVESSPGDEMVVASCGSTPSALSASTDVISSVDSSLNISHSTCCHNRSRRPSSRLVIHLDNVSNSCTNSQPGGN